ncbi:hypothetical protein C8R46DRAFT_1227714 [Mycena filopes]|nr:hypothetical protein C8R46DRAFT_1227714 [Mycena filopes]
MNLVVLTKPAATSSSASSSPERTSSMAPPTPPNDLARRPRDSSTSPTSRRLSSVCCGRVEAVSRFHACEVRIRASMHLSIRWTWARTAASDFPRRGSPSGPVWCDMYAAGASAVDVKPVGVEAHPEQRNYSPWRLGLLPPDTAHRAGGRGLRVCRSDMSAGPLAIIPLIGRAERRITNPVPIHPRRLDRPRETQSVVCWTRLTLARTPASDSSAANTWHRGSAQLEYSPRPSPPSLPSLPRHSSHDILPNLADAAPPWAEDARRGGLARFHGCELRRSGVGGV